MPVMLLRPDEIALARHLAGMYQYQLVEATGISRATISNLERIGGNPQYETLLAITEAIRAVDPLVFGQLLSGEATGANTEEET